MMIKFFKQNPILIVMIPLLILAGFVVPTKAPETETQNVGGPKKYTNYDFWYITKEDDVHISEVAVRFFEGHYAIDPEGNQFYKIDRKLEPDIDLAYLQNKKFRKEKSGVKTIVYTAEDFGVITTDKELTDFLDKQIAKDKGRQVIPEQKIK